MPTVGVGTPFVAIGAVLEDALVLAAEVVERDVAGIDVLVVVLGVVTVETAGLGDGDLVSQTSFLGVAWLLYTSDAADE